MIGKYSTTRIVATVLSLILASAVFLPTQVARAASINVNSTSDGTSEFYCTLRDAITAADTDTAKGGCPAGAGADTIVLASGATYTLTDGGLPAVHSEITIEGNGSTIERSFAGSTPEFRIFYLSASGDLTLNEVTVSNGVTVPGGGGGIKNWGKLTMNHSNVSGNMGCGILTLEGSSVNINHSAINDNDGGGIINIRGSMSIDNSTVSGNYDNLNGGGIHNYYGSAVIKNSTVSGNFATSSGGGIYVRGNVLTLTNSIVSDNTEDGINGGGGGIHVYDNGELTMINSIVKGNSARQGGGIRIYRYSAATVIDSTISENTVLSDTAGGIHLSYFGEVTLVNSTVSNNYGGVGSGIWNSGSSKTTLINSTISHNSPIPSYLGGIANWGEFTMQNSIVANQLSGRDCYGGKAVTSLGYNLDSDGSCNLSATGDLSGFDPLLGPLADNGGPTWTHALLPGSPAIDAVPITSCSVPTDQRGVSRPQGPACDIGAFEVEYLVVDIDIKPGSDPNSINLDSMGVVPVAVLTTDDFDASTVDPVTAEFAGAFPLRWTTEDVDLDSDMDLLFHYKTLELNLGESSTEAILTGKTFDNLLLYGKDEVQIVPIQ